MKMNSQVFCCPSMIDSPCCCPSGPTTIFLLEPHFYRLLSASDWHSGGLLQALFPIVYGQLWLEYFPLAWPRPSCTFWDSPCLNSFWSLLHRTLTCTPQSHGSPLPSLSPSPPSFTGPSSNTSPVYLILSWFLPLRGPELTQRCSWSFPWVSCHWYLVWAASWPGSSSPPCPPYRISQLSWPKDSPLWSGHFPKAHLLLLFSTTCSDLYVQNLELKSLNPPQ